MKLFHSIKNFQLNGSIRPVPPPRDHLRMEKDGRMVNRAPAPQVPDRNHPLQSNQIAQVVDATPEQLDSIKKYQVSPSLNLSELRPHYNSIYEFSLYQPMNMKKYETKQNKKKMKNNEWRHLLSLKFIKPMTIHTLSMKLFFQTFT